MPYRFFLVFLAAVCAAPPALAAGIRISRGIGHDCYIATLMPASQDNDRRALAVCSQAVGDNANNSPDRAKSLINRSDILIRMGRFGEAVADADHSLAIDQNMAAGHLNRGAGLVGMQRYDEALVSLNHAIALEAKRLELAYYDRAIAREATGDIKGAYLDFRKASELAPEFQLASQQLARFKVTPANP